MTKYKLEYIWLDGYTPVPNLRGKTQIKEYQLVPVARAAAAVGLRRQLDHAGRGPQLRLRSEAGPHLPRQRAHERRARAVRSDDAGRRDAAPVQQARDHPRRRGRLVRLRAGIFLLQERPPARLPRSRLSRRRRGPTTPASATARSATSRARSSRSISTSASPPASTTRASTPRWPRASGNSRSSARAPSAPPTRCGSPATCMERLTEKYGIDIEYHCKPLGDTDWNGSGMHANFSTAYHARDRRQGVFREADGGLRGRRAPTTSPSTVRTTTCA